jgi:hypothetical protein
MKRLWLIAGAAALAFTFLGFQLGQAREASRSHHEVYSSLSQRLVMRHLNMSFILEMLARPCASELRPLLEKELVSEVGVVYGALAEHGTLAAPDSWRLIKPMLMAAGYFRSHASHPAAARQAAFVASKLSSG